MSSCDIYSFKRFKPISPLTFSWYSNACVKKNSVFQLESSDDINDLRLGSTVEENCLSCGMGWKTCPGHYGHYEFFRPLIHPLRTIQAKELFASTVKGKKFNIKQKILNVKDATSQWRSMTVYDLDDYDPKYTDIDKDYPFLVQNFPISPPCLRPTCVTVSSKISISQNDITHRLGSLIRIDKTLRKCYELNPKNIEEQTRILTRLQLAFTLLFFPPPGQRESRELSCLTDRLKGKEGRMRLTLLGKRVEFSARSVISGDNYLEIDQVGVPTAIARALTVPEYVTGFNKEYLTKLLQTDMVKTIQRGNRSINPKYGIHDLRIGDVIHRYLMNDDYVLLNRQPSLWASSIQALRVKLVPKNATVDPYSLRLNVEITAGFNADFDGDEMCLYAVQSIEARAEMKLLMSCEEHLIIAGNGLIQDSALGIYILTSEDKIITKSLFFDCIMWIKEPHFDENPYAPPYTSRRLISFLFPNWLSYEDYIKNGMVKKALNKKITRNKILPLIHKNNKRSALNFLYSLQRVCSEYLRRRGFSVGLDTLLPDKKVDLNVENNYTGLNKWQMGCITRRLKDEKAIQAKKIFNKKNNFMVLTSEGSGAKGSLMNLIQMKSSLGQQSVNGDVIQTYRSSNYGHRVLSSDKFGEKNIFTQGFIKGGFLPGLNPKEMFLHSISSRINLLDTALKTANSGYASRKLWKNLEDAVVEHPTFEGGPYSVRCAGKMLRFAINTDSLRNRSIVPGFPIGIILSQTVGQNIMQLTLNTFHNVGSGNAIVEGVPRLESLINRWEKKQEQQSMLSVDMNPYEIHKNIYRRDFLCMADVVNNITCKKKKIHLQCDKNFCIRKRVHPWQLEQALNNSFLFPVFQATINTKFLITIQIKVDAPFDKWKELVHDIKHIVIRGKEGVSLFDADGELQITGIKLSKEIARKSTTALKTVSNNVIETRRTLGIEAAYTTLVNELDKVFNHSVDKILFKILAEYMCYLGKITSTTRMGLTAFYGEENVWKGMSFERTLKTASTAADKQISTSFEGLSEKILVNDIPKHGTGCIDIIKEKSDCGHEECWKNHCLYLQENKFNNLKRKRFDDAEEPWITEDGFNNNPFSGGEWNPWGQQSYTMPSQIPFSQIVKDVVVERKVSDRPLSPDYDPNRPPSPEYDPKKSYVPISPEYDPEHPF